MSLVREFDAAKIPAKSKPQDRSIVLYGLTAVSIVAMAALSYMALVYAGTDVTQGQVQRIFYFHVGSFFGAFVAFSIAVVAGGLYLKNRTAKWDALALAAIEVGLLLSTINLVTGMVWARPIWNTWWTWDPRLTSAAIMVLTYAAYLMLRAGIENPDKQRIFASVYGMLAFLTVIFTTVIIRIRPDTIHPAVIGASPTNAEGTFEMATNMTTTLGISALVFCLILTPTLIWWRIRLETMNERIRHLQTDVLSQ